MNELDEFKNLLERFGIPFTEFHDEEFIMEAAVNNGAVRTVCIRDEVDIAFDMKGAFVGSYTHSSGSYKSR